MIDSSLGSEVRLFSYHDYSRKDSVTHKQQQQVSELEQREKGGAELGVNK